MEYAATCVLTVGDNELGVGDDEDASSEAAEGCGTHARMLRDHMVDWASWLAGPRFLRGAQALSVAVGAKKFHKCICHHHIRVLLRKTNPMIYICYIKYGGNGVTCVLAVGDDELDMGDNGGALLEVAGGAGRPEEVMRMGLERKITEKEHVRASP
jgi:hypothetical protein